MSLLSAVRSCWRSAHSWPRAYDCDHSWETALQRDPQVVCVCVWVWAVCAVCLCKCVYLNVSVWCGMCVPVRVCMWMCVWAHVWYVCACPYVCVFLSVWVCVYSVLCVSVSMCKSVCDCVCFYRGNTDHFRKVNALIKFLLPNNSLYEFFFQITF